MNFSLKGKRIYSLFVAAILLFSLSQSSYSQDAKKMGLSEVIKFAIENNKNVKVKQLDSKLYAAQVDEVAASGYPQINFNTRFDDNLVVQTSVIPQKAFGGPEGKYTFVNFGVQYSMYGGLDINQLIYSHTYWTGLKAAKSAQELAKLSYENSKDEIAYNLSAFYYAALITSRQIEMVKTNLIKIEKLIEIAKISEENGVINKIDLDRLIVSKTNTETELSNAQTSLSQQMMTIKVYMGMPLDSQLELIDEIKSEEINAKNNANSDFLEKRNDLLLASKNIELLNLERESIVAGYYPTLSAIGRVYWWSYGDGKSLSVGSTFFPQQLIGLSLNIPIFDGLNKSARAQQSEVKIEKASLQYDFMKESITLEVRVAKEKLENSRKNLNAQKDNVKLANDVYSQTQLKYQQGVATFSDIVNAESAMKDAQNNYMRSLLQTMLSQVDLRKADGSILNFAK